VRAVPVQQIDVIKPKVIVALGKFAAQTLLRRDADLAPARAAVRLPRREADSDISPCVSAAEPVLEARYGRI
jgi:uracil-DNA glycosylase